MFSRLGGFIILFTISLFSCSKKEKVFLPENFPATFYAERIELKNRSKIFTSTGEIKNNSLIEFWEEELNWPNSIEEDFNLTKDSLKFAFTSDSTALLIHKTLPERYVSDRTGTRFVLSSFNHYPIQLTLPPVDNQLGYLYHMLKYKEKIVTVNSSTNNIETKTKDIRVAHGNYKVMKIPIIEYVLRTHNEEGNRISLSGKIFNEFDHNNVKYLRAQDTLIINEHAIIFTLIN